MKSGVYRILNLKTGKCYIGSTFNLVRRLRQHRTALQLGTHKNRHLQNAWNLNGESSFIFETLITCEPQDCVVFEQRYLDLLFKLDALYNCLNRAVVPTAEVRAAIRSKLKYSRPWQLGVKRPETGPKISAANKGRILTAEQRAKVSAGKLGKSLHPYSLACVNLGKVRKSSSIVSIMPYVAAKAVWSLFRTVPASQLQCRRLGRRVRMSQEEYNEQRRLRRRRLACL